MQVGTVNQMTVLASFGEPIGQGWTQVGELAVAFGLSAVIGLEREIKQKAAGIRTYTVVGFASALFVLVSKYGFTDVLAPGRVILDPSRVAAQIVSGVGFIGGGIIFVRRDMVRGLTTAASVWLTAAIGAAAGAGLPILAALSTGAYFGAVLGLPPATRLITRRLGIQWPSLRVHYLDGRGLLREVLAALTQAGFFVADITTVHLTGDRNDGAPEANRDRPSVEATVQLGGKGDLQGVIARLSEVDGVLAISTIEEQVS